MTFAVDSRDYNKTQVATLSRYILQYPHVWLVLAYKISSKTQGSFSLDFENKTEWLMTMCFVFFKSISYH